VRPVSGTKRAPLGLELKGGDLAMERDADVMKPPIVDTAFLPVCIIKPVTFAASSMVRSNRRPAAPRSP